jgi:hypothetical protein
LKKPFQNKQTTSKKGQQTPQNASFSKDSRESKNQKAGFSTSRELIWVDAAPLKEGMFEQCKQLIQQIKTIEKLIEEFTSIEPNYQAWISHDIDPIEKEIKEKRSRVDKLEELIFTIRTYASLHKVSCNEAYAIISSNVKEAVQDPSEFSQRYSEWGSSEDVLKDLAAMFGHRAPENDGHGFSSSPPSQSNSHAASHPSEDTSFDPSEQEEEWDPTYAESWEKFEQKAQEFAQKNSWKQKSGPKNKNTFEKHFEFCENFYYQHAPRPKRPSGNLREGSVQQRIYHNRMQRNNYYFDKFLDYIFGNREPGKAWNFEELFSQNSSNEESAEFKKQQLKTLYRELARHFHPDLDPSTNPERAEIFRKTVAAYEAQDLEGLKILHFNSITFTDDCQSHDLFTLQSLKKKLQAELKHFKDIKKGFHRSWKFKFFLLISKVPFLKEDPSDEKSHELKKLKENYKQTLEKNLTNVNVELNRLESIMSEWKIFASKPQQSKKSKKKNRHFNQQNP